MSDVIDGLNGLLADATVFYYKIHNYHWNVRGPQFFSLHEEFEKLYTEWATVVDDLAERILALGGRPVPTLAACLKLARVVEETGTPDASGMVGAILNGLHAQRERMKEVSATAQKADDKTTENILDDFLDSMAKHAWMYAAFLGRGVNED